MKTIPLRALKGCPKQEIGAEFMANSRDARALVALGRAEYTDPNKTYKTRALTAAPSNRALQAGSQNKILIADSVRAFAVQNGIDVAAMVGSGQNGRILKSDIQALIPN